MHLIFLSSLVSANPNDSTQTNTESSQKGPETTESETTEPTETKTTEIEQPPKKISGPLVKIKIELINGVVIEGDASVQSLIVWDNGQDLDAIVNGEVLHFGGDRIASVSQISVQQSQNQGQNNNQSGSQINVNINDSDSEEITLEPSAKGFSYHNPAASRYLYAPSSLALKKGESYLSQKSFIFTSGAVGVTDNITVLGGTFTFNPLMLSIVGGKYSYEVAPNVAVSVGGEVFFTTFGSFDALASVAFAGVTYGDEDTNVTVNVAGGQVLDQVGFPITLCASHRFSDRYAIMTENWLLIQQDKQYSWNGQDVELVDSSLGSDTAIFSVAIRMMGRSTRWFSQQEYYAKGRYGGKVKLNPSASFDYGLLYVVVNDLSEPWGPIPWVDWAWKF